MTLTKDEAELLNWLSDDDDRHGDCQGWALNALMARGLVEWKYRDQRGDRYGWVGLTNAGHEALDRSPGGK